MMSKAVTSLVRVFGLNRKKTFEQSGSAVELGFIKRTIFFFINLRIEKTKDAFSVWLKNLKEFLKHNVFDSQSKTAV